MCIRDSLETVATGNAANIFSFEHYLARCGRLQQVEKAQKDALSRAARPQEDKDLPRVNHKVLDIEDDPAVVCLFQLAGFDYRLQTSIPSHGQPSRKPDPYPALLVPRQDDVNNDLSLIHISEPT